VEKDYLYFAIKIAKEAGDIMRAHFSLGMKKEWKEDNSPLTITDTAINELVIQKVKESFPEHGVLGEEASLETTDATHIWVVDPVDGTIPFSHGVPTFAFSLALVVDGVPQLGVVFDVM
jgi:inositol-phosphate phosphatase / L-galactose 1-phosphate phosphatase / histidinol-phosphatase